MAKKTTPDTEVTQEAPAQMVQLKCEKLGIDSKDFTPGHAKALLEFQQSKGIKDWQPVTAETEVATA
jgi:hypothetical protein